MQESKWKAPLITLATVAVLLGIPGIVLYKLSQAEVPGSRPMGMNKFTLGTLRNLAISQSKAGLHAEAASNFSSYFDLGGKDDEAKAYYEASLKALKEQQKAANKGH